MSNDEVLRAFEPGSLLGTSEWFPMEQSTFTDFEVLTRSNDPLHTDPEWVREHTRYPDTIAPGFLSLSLLPYLFAQLNAVPHGYHAVNYGLNKVRWVEPVPVGARVRARFDCLSRTDRKDNKPGSIVEFDVLLEIEGVDRPAMRAAWLGAIIPDTD